MKTRTEIVTLGALACVLGLVVVAFGAGNEPIVTNGGAKPYAYAGHTICPEDWMLIK